MRFESRWKSMACRAFICTAVAVVGGCSSGAPFSPADDGTRPDPTGDASVGPDPYACTEAGTTRACRTSIASNRGFLLCANGQQECTAGRWTSCTTTATSAGEDGWMPESVGCDVPPEPCSVEGESRACRHYLPAEPNTSNCYEGHQRCMAGAWTACIRG